MLYVEFNHFSQIPDAGRGAAVYWGGAMLALVAAIMLSRWEVPGTAVLQGMLFGFSIVGNLFSIWQWRKKGNN